MPAGLRSAVCALCALDEFRIGRDDVAVTRVNLDGWHAIRVRNYEPDLREVKVRLQPPPAPRSRRFSSS